MKGNANMINAIELIAKIKREMITLQQDYATLLHAVGEAVGEWNDMATENALLRVKTEFQQSSNKMQTECEQRSNNVQTELEQRSNKKRTKFKHNSNKVRNHGKNHKCGNSER